MICPTCNYSNRKKSLFCLQCGGRVAQICLQCRWVLPLDARYCDRCGTPQPVQPRDSALTSPTAAAALSPRPPRELRDEKKDNLSNSLELPVNQLEKLLPPELAAKLDAARAGGEMVGERRVVTMLFCDVRGSTEAAGRLDPEEWTEIINGAFQHMIQPVYKYEGTVARLMGDGILAFFGAPIAHEDDPQRAILAGLEIVEGIQGYRKVVGTQADVDIDVRVGINTGMVVVGTVGSDLRMEYTAMGDAINLAARMEQSAQPGTVQISEQTYRLVAPLFEVTNLGGLAIKGKAAPVQAYRVEGIKMAPGRLRGISGLSSPMVGRDREFSQALLALEEARSGNGQIVAIIGEAGLGKSRLIRELRAHWETAAGMASPAGGWKETAALSYQTGLPYDTFQQQIRQAAGIAFGDDPGAIQAKLDGLSHGEAIPPEMRPLHEMLFRTQETGPSDGEAFHRDLYAAMLSLTRYDTRHQPVAYVTDDLHWADSASLDLQAHAMQLLPELPVLVILAFRPDRESPIWRLREKIRVEYAERYTEIVLQPLNPTQGSELVNHLLASADLPEQLRTRILDRADGNPFFVEEILRNLIDQGVLVQNQSLTRWQAVGNPEQIDLPANLQSLLTARIDRLEESVRHTLQLAAVIGRSFYQRVLAAIDKQGHLLDRKLADLQRMEIIMEKAQLPEHEFMFRHTMTQQAVYNTLLLKHRREFHSQVGQALETLFPKRREEMAPALAHHFAQAEDAKKAFFYFAQAGAAALRLYALEEGVRYFRNALKFADQTDEEELAQLYTQLGRTLELQHRYSDAIALYAEMEQVGQKRQSATLRIAGLIGQATALTVSELYDPQQALALIKEGLALAEIEGTAAQQSKALWTMMLVQMYGFNQMAAALGYGERSLELARQLGLTEQIAYVLSDLAIACGQVGQQAKMISYLDEVLPLWEGMGNKAMLASTYHYMAIVAQIQGRYKEAMEHAETGYALGVEIDNLFAQGGCLGVIGWVCKEMGQLGQAIAALEARQEVYTRAGGSAWDGRTVELGLLFADLGMPPEILARFRDYKELAERSPSLYRSWILTYFAHLEVQMGELQSAHETLATVADSLDVDSFSNGTWATYYLALGRLALAEENAKRACEHFATGAAWCQDYQIEGPLIELLFYQGQALLTLENHEDACTILEKAYIIAEARQAHWRLWQIAGLLVRITGSERRRKELLAVARNLLASIEANAGPPEIQQAILHMPLAQEIRQADG